MSSYVKNTLNNHKPSDRDKHLLELIFGEPSYSEPINNFWYIIVLTLILTIIFLSLVGYSYNNSTNNQKLLAGTGVIFFVLTLIVLYLYANSNWG